MLWLLVKNINIRAYGKYKTLWQYIDALKGNINGVFDKITTVIEYLSTHVHNDFVFFKEQVIIRNAISLVGTKN